METAKLSPRTLSAVAASAALLTAGLAPVAATADIGPRTLVEAVSVDVALASAAVVDVLADLGTAASFDTPDVAEAFGMPDVAAMFGTPGVAEAFGTPGIAEALDLPGAAAAFDIVGLINAEIAALQGMFNSLFSLPVTLFNDVQSMVTNLVDLNFGMAFSDMVSIPLDIVNYVIGLPGMLANTAYQMAIVIPGEFLFNFG